MRVFQVLFEVHAELSLERSQGRQCSRSQDDRARAQLFDLVETHSRVKAQELESACLGVRLWDMECGGAVDD